MAEVLSAGTRFTSDLPPRLDRLPWSTWHWRVVIALGITWMLDGLEVTLVGAIGNVLREKQALGLTESQIGGTASAYLAGAIVGALLFGRLTDRLGRKRLFLVTLAVYLFATLATAFSWSFASFAVFRALTGAGIGGEYSAVNSAIDELLPASVRGRADLAINSTYWLGTALGAVASIFLLNPRFLPHSLGWRACFGLGAVLGASVLFIRHHVPESPRWLLLHGRVDEARLVVEDIEKEVAAARKRAGKGALPPVGAARQLEAKGTITFRWIGHVLLKQHPRRTLLGLALMIAQAFAYNGVFFTYALVLGRYYGVPSDHIGLYLLPFAGGNLLGPLVLGPLFDTWGRRRMIALTYGLSGVLIALTGYALAEGWLTATTQTALWCAVFFVASAAASSAYLTVSELFPVELRGMAIALFYAAGTAAGGLAAPTLFGALIQTGRRSEVLVGYLVGGALMVLAALVAVVLGVDSEGKSLEQIAELRRRRPPRLRRRQGGPLARSRPCSRPR
ncbi:MAG: MFS transporter [Myxococcota bacterium]|nr:MFS transporter [Myxococcota bacterium]